MTAPEPPDEDVLTLPPAWLRILHPRRGGVTVPPPRGDHAGEVPALLDNVAFSEPPATAPTPSYGASPLNGTSSWKLDSRDPGTLSVRRVRTATGSRGAGAPVPFGDLDPVAVSEALTDLTALTGATL